MRVLYVEDNAHDAELYSEALREMGCQVTTARSAAEAILRVSSDQPFDAFVLDLALGYDRGETVAEKIKEQQPQAKCVFLTARIWEARDFPDGLRACAVVSKVPRLERVKLELTKALLGAEL